MQWEDIREARQYVQSKIHFNQHWLVLFDHDKAAQHVMHFEHEFFKTDKKGYEHIIVPLTIENMGMYTLNIMLVDKRKVNAVQMARFMNTICKIAVGVSDIEDTNQLCWSDQESGAVMFQMLDIFLGKDFEQVN
jgi:hypothetical protein